MPKKMTKKGLKKKVWKEISYFIKKRDNYICWLCESKLDGSNAHCSHILPKGEFPRYEFEEWNLKTLCYHCHLNFWHKNPLMAAIKFKKNYPDNFREAVEKAHFYTANELKTYTEEELMSKYKYYLEKNS